ncbi:MULTISPECIES: TonB-dependent siderophore receptor [Sphingomonas]|uniref:TonB-dependent siderophore receptor n=1 Tax=Edaphosphingomonas fennica TaxID=114404 RepID=A0A2T4I590_9SPHN|nr:MULTISPECIES: TonB-dependent siderophore receptor [Sphingomonas]AGH50389.1 TonB-dependent siderophore receptor, putative [Sphingomonas sp. MM-1]PTD25128.1 TonB-dependent siderophore receptor [Sphingomonas fennica]
MGSAKGRSGAFPFGGSATALALVIGLATAPARAEDAASAPVDPADIIVTGAQYQSPIGTKTDTPLIDTPQAITVVSAERFLEMGALNLQDTLRYTAGVRTEAYGLDTRGDYGFVRGTEPGVYQDGMRRSFGYRQGSRQEIFTLSSVEVLRGPSSMLYGQAPIGGLVNTTSKRPQFDFGGEGFVSYGTFDRKEAGIDVTGPLLGDQLAARLVAVWRDADSQTDHAREKRWTINPSLTWRMGSDTELTLIGLVQDDNNGWTGQFLPYVSTLFGKDHPLGPLPWSRNLGEPSVDKVDYNTEWVSAQFSHRFSEALQFRQNARYEWFKSSQILHYADIYGGSPAAPYLDPADPYLNAVFPEYAALGPNRVLNRYAFGEVFHSRTLTTDSQLQADFATGPLTHKLLVGFDYAHYKTRERDAFAMSNNGFDEDGNPIPPGTTPIDAYNPVYGNVMPLTFYDVPDTKQEQTGFYVQDQIKAFDKATLLVGLRYDRATNDTEGAERFVDHAWTTRIAFLYEIAPGVVPYVSYTESFQPIAGADFYGQPYDPTRGRQYEIGVKWQPDPATFVTVTAYDMKDSGRLVNDPSNPNNQIQAGKVRTKGFEVEASRSIANDLDIIASYSYTRARDSNLSDQIDAGVGLSTNQLESIPKHLASIWAMKHVAVTDEAKLRIGAGLRYVSDSYSPTYDVNFVPYTLVTPDYLAADAMIGLDYGAWRLSLNATNLTDKKYYTTCLGRGDCFLGLRRTVNFSVGYRF